jgi:N-acetylneuraminic acid mutarotase
MSELQRPARATVAAAILFGLGACDLGESGPTAPDPAGPTPPQAAGPAPNLGTTWASNSWVTRSQLTSPRIGAVAAAVNGAIYLIGGQADTHLPGMPALRTVEKHNPDGQLLVWYKRAELPEGRAYTSGAAVINGKIYVPGGVSLYSSLTRSLFVYTPGTDTWATKANHPVPTAWGASAAINGKLFVFTPRYGDTGPRLYRYDPGSNTWTKRANPPHDHRQPASGVIDGKFYVVGGAAPAAGKTQTAVLDVYDPGTNTWTTKKAMPTARYGAAAQALGGKLYVVGGRSGSAALGALEVYNPATNTWAQKASMPTPRYDLAAAKVDGILYALGGYRYNTVATNEAYKP